MKRKIALILAIILLLSMSACGGNSNIEDTGDTLQATQQTDTLQTTEPVNGSTTGDTEPEPTTVEDATPEPTTEPVSVEGNPTEPDTTEPSTTAPKPMEPTPTTPVAPTPTEPKPTVPTEPKPTEPKPTEPTPTVPAPTEPKPTTPAPTEPKPTEPTPTVPAPTEPKPTTPAPTEPTPTVPTPTEPKPTEPVAKPYIIGLEIVSSNMPNAYYCSNGQDLLSRMYGGKNKAFQTGDSVTIRVNMSDGGNDFTIRKYAGCTITSQNGNLIELTFDGSNSRANIFIDAYNESGKKVSKSIGFTVVRYRGKITEDWTTIYVELTNYAVRIGLTWVNNGSDMTGYTHDDESKSITGYTVRGADDFVPIPGNSRWIEKALWVLDTYKSMGLNRVNFNVVLANGFQSVAE